MHVLKPLDPGVVTRPPTDVAPKAIISHALQGVANRPRLLPPVGFRDAWQMAAPSASRGVLQPMLEAQRQHLLHWERTVADTRIHGTTKQQVLKVYEEVERPALLPLPREC